MDRPVEALAGVTGCAWNVRVNWKDAGNDTAPADRPRQPCGSRRIPPSHALYFTPARTVNFRKTQWRSMSWLKSVHRAFLAQRSLCYKVATWRGAYGSSLRSASAYARAVLLGGIMSSAASARASKGAYPLLVIRGYTHLAARQRPEVKTIRLIITESQRIEPRRRHSGEYWL